MYLFFFLHFLFFASLPTIVKKNVACRKIFWKTLPQKVKITKQKLKPGVRKGCFVPILSPLLMVSHKQELPVYYSIGYPYATQVSLAQRVLNMKVNDNLACVASFPYERQSVFRIETLRSYRNVTPPNEN